MIPPLSFGRGINQEIPLSIYTVAQVRPCCAAVSFGAGCYSSFLLCLHSGLLDAYSYDRSVFEEKDTPQQRAKLEAEAAQARAQYEGKKPGSGSTRGEATTLVAGVTSVAPRRPMGYSRGGHHGGGGPGRGVFRSRSPMKRY